VLATTDEGVRDPESDFEVSVANVVSSLGYEVKPQLGVAGFFIDMAVRNPDRPGEFLAGIECDGATYHSGFSVRGQGIASARRFWSPWVGADASIAFGRPTGSTTRAGKIDRLRGFLEERRRLSVNGGALGLGRGRGFSRRRSVLNPLKPPWSKIW
jgi:hypothetical protein